MTVKELESYTFIDSVSQENKIEQKMNTAYSIISSKLDLGKIDLNLDRLLAFNDYENVRVGLGFQTNEKLIKNLSFGGYAAYGFRDKAFKYGGEIDWNISKKHHINLKTGYKNDLKTPGTLDIPRWKYGRHNIRYTHQEITPNSD